MKQPWTYRRAGVDIDAGDALVDYIRKKAPSVGDFAGLYPLPKGLNQPRLVACTDGVGTKLKIAQTLGIHHTVGIDLVAMNVNDLICCGAKPLLFLDYYACGKLDLTVARQVMDGILEGCRQGECTLLGGETAEMPGFYPPGEYDLAGFAVGLVEKEKQFKPHTIQPGDVLLALPSSGIHSNGYSLVRALFKGQDLKKWGKKLLTPTRIYVKDLRTLLTKFPGSVKGLAHITGGGLLENIPRFLPRTCDAVLHVATWPLPDIFSEMQERGSVPMEEMFRTFNMGLGLVACVTRENARKITHAFPQWLRVGVIERGRRRVVRA